MALENEVAKENSDEREQSRTDVAVPTRSAPQQNYMHTTLDAKPRSTPEFFRLFLSAIPMRYMPRAAAAFKGYFIDHKKMSPRVGARFDAAGDAAVGVLSLAMTRKYTQQTKHDIMLGFTEMVAMEVGKQPQQVTWKDFQHSNNALVKETLETFRKRTVARYATDAPFFLRAALMPFFKWAPYVDATYLALGFKGMLLYQGVTGRKETFFETLVDIMDKRINPSKGLGDYVHTTDLVTLYQQYAEIDHSHVKFIGLDDRKIWAKSEVMFSRMAELMNRTYQYSAASGEPFSAHPTADFPMPKFLYLLGFGMIDPKQVDRSLAYIEVANHYGIDEVKDLKRQLDHGVDIAEAMKKYPEANTPDAIKNKYAKSPSSPETKSPLVQRFAPAGNWSERAAKQETTPSSSPSI